MENKLCLWISLVVGVPLFRMIEVVSIARSTAGASQIDFARHAALGLIIGVGCALAAKILKLEGRRLTLLPVLAVGYAMLLIGVTYPHAMFSMQSSFVTTLLMMDMGSWIIAVGGATLIGAVAMRPRTARPMGGAIPRPGRV